MNKLKTLILFNLKYFLKPRFKDEKAKKKYIGMMITLCLVMLLPIAEMVYVIYVITSAVIETSDPSYLISSICVATQIATIFLGIVTYLQVMYFSNDNEFLATLPLSSIQIFISKLVTVVAMELIVSMVVLIPATIVMAVAFANAGLALSAAYYILIPIAIVTMPFLPILVVAILSFPIMKIVSYFRKHPTLGAIVTVIFIVGLIAAIYIPLYSNIYSTPVSDDASLEEGVTSMFGADSINIITSLGKYSYHTFCLANAMLGKNIAVNLLIYFGITLVAFVIGTLLASVLYRSTIGTFTEGGSIKHSAKKGQEFIVYNSNKTLLNREFKVLIRDSQKFLNVLMSIILTPVMVFIMMYIMNLALTDIVEESGSPLGIQFLVGLSAMLTMWMIGGSNVGVSAGFSLEGKSFVLFKTLPVRYKDIFKSKLVLNDIFDLASITVTALIVLFYAKANVVDFIGFIGTIFLFVLSINSFALFRDLKNPKLEWSNIKEITKNNFSTLIPLAVALPGAIITMVLSIVFAKVNLNPYLCSLLYWLCVAVVSTIYYFILRHGVYNKVDKYFEEVEC